MDGSTIFPTLETLAVSRLEPSDEQAWRDFLATRPDATPFHTLEWRDAVRAGLGYDTPYLIAKAGGEVAGILPLVHVKTPLFGNNLVSTGFSVGGGVMARNGEVAEALAAAAIRLGRERKVDCLELRGEAATFDGWATKSETYAGFRAPLAATSDDRLKAIPRKKRADVRKGIKSDLTIDTDAPVTVFHDLYARNLHALGTPILPLKWYAALKSAFGDACEVSTVNGPDGPVVSLMTFWWGDTVYPYYVGALAEARKLHAFDHVYWELMERAGERGIATFDFGRSKYGTGSFDYKKYWGFEPQALHYQYHLIGASKMPDVNPNNPKYARFVSTWQKLPFGVTKRVGPFLARQLG
jgi:FemAB-related protein (PEP-CTERM system-associated)